MAEIGLWSITIPAAAGTPAVYTLSTKDLVEAMERLTAKKATESDLPKPVPPMLKKDVDAYEWAF